MPHFTMNLASIHSITWDTNTLQPGAHGLQHFTTGLVKILLCIPNERVDTCNSKSHTTLICYQFKKGLASIIFFFLRDQISKFMRHKYKHLSLEHVTIPNSSSLLHRAKHGRLLFNPCAAAWRSGKRV